MSRSLPALLTLAIGAALLGTAPAADAAAKKAPPAAMAVPQADKAARLETLYADYWEAQLKLNPLQATFQGDPRYNDQLPNFLSAEYRAQAGAFTREWLAKAKAIGPDGLSGQALLSYEIFVREGEQSIEGEQFPGWMQPIDQFSSIAALTAQLGSGTGAQPFKTVKDYDDWLKRAAQIPVLFDQSIANMQQGVAAGVVQPRALMQKVVPQFDALIKPKAEDTLFWGPIKAFPADFSEADKTRLTAAYRTLIDAQLMPSFKKLRDYIANEYMPKTRSTSGLAALPNGAAWYAFEVRNNTTTDVSAADIHQIGLSEVARIQGEMLGVMKEVKFKGDLHAFFKFMQTSKQFQFKDEAGLLSYYRSLEKKVDDGVPRLFSVKPKAAFEIRPVEAFRAESAAGGEYQGPSEDGTRPGIFYVNTFNVPSRKTWDAEDLYLHEAIPGHHFQIALQQELTGIPKFRRFGGETAYIEGWGLYSESLGKALGVYEDPYSYFGYLQNEMWRAIRLVTDTGLHSKGWTREQVIKYMLDNSAESEGQSTAEAERYMAIPGQALAYKTGEMKILQLREKAKAQLGDKFDIRAFHTEVLKDGSVPLGVLEAKIDRWIADVRAGKVATH